MESFTDFSVLFLDGHTETFSHSYLKSVARRLHFRNLPLKEQPLMITELGTGKKFYYNADAMEKYQDNRMTIDALVRASWCDGLYRNKNKLITTGKDEIEADSLFLRRGDEIILLDGDKFHTGSWNTAEQLFYEIG